MEKVAVVTGANKGIGYGIMKALSEQFDGIIYLTARDESRGMEALRSIQDLGVCKIPEKLRFHQLDIVDKSSVQKLHDDILSQHGGLDVLINNAGISSRSLPETLSPAEKAETVIQTNYFALVNLCNVLFPLLRPHARVVNLASSFSLVSNVEREELRGKLLDEELREDELSAMMTDFVKLVKEGKHEGAGWPGSAYMVSKIAIAKLSFIQHATLSGDPSRADIIVNPVHPGYVDTDLTQVAQHAQKLTIEEGARSPVYAALLPPNVSEPRGQFIWHDCTIIPWSKPRNLYE